MSYELFDAAPRTAGIYPRHQDRFIDRGDGLLALIRPVDQASNALFLNCVVSAFTRLLSAYNASLPPKAVRKGRYGSAPSATPGRSTTIQTDVTARPGYRLPATRRPGGHTGSQ